MFRKGNKEKGKRVTLDFRISLNQGLTCSCYVPEADFISHSEAESGPHPSVKVRETLGATHDLHLLIEIDHSDHSLLDDGDWGVLHFNGLLVIVDSIHAVTLVSKQF